MIIRYDPADVVKKYEYEYEVPAIVKQSQVIAVLILPLLCSFDAHAQEDWAGCVERLRKSAIAEGIASRTVDDVFDEVEQLPRVISSDRAQPEFTRTFTDYYTRRVTSSRTPSPCAIGAAPSCAARYAL